MDESAAEPTGRKVKKVGLRRIESADWVAVHGWASMAESCVYQPWGPNTEAETQEFVARAVAAWDARPQVRYVYLALADGRTVGSGEVLVRNAEHRHGEIAYGVHPSLWGQGYGTALARALAAVGFQQLGFHRITATCDPRNVGSARVLEHAGFRYEGRMRETLLLRDGWRDSSVYSLLETSPAPR